MEQSGGRGVFEVALAHICEGEIIRYLRRMVEV